MADTISDKLVRLNEVKQQIKQSIIDKGVSVADTDTFASYADKIGQIETGGGGEVVDRTKFGLTIDSLLGDVDADGTLDVPTGSFVADFSGVNKFGNNALRYKFYVSSAITGFLAPSLTTVGSNGMYSAFTSCYSLKSVDLSLLQTVEDYGLYSAFSNCAYLENIAIGSIKTVGNNGMSSCCSSCLRLTSVSMESLQTIGKYGLQQAFSSCSRLESVNLDSLQTVGENGLYGAFSGCKALTSISFPSLTSVVATSFGSTSAYSHIFNNCTALTEIHFRADMQAAIEATNGYTNKWGATNATIYFDL